MGVRPSRVLVNCSRRIGADQDVPVMPPETLFPEYHAWPALDSIPDLVVHRST